MDKEGKTILPHTACMYEPGTKEALASCGACMSGVTVQPIPNVCPLSLMSKGESSESSEGSEGSEKSKSGEKSKNSEKSEKGGKENDGQSSQAQPREPSFLSMDESEESGEFSVGPPEHKSLYLRCVQLAATVTPFLNYLKPACQAMTCACMGCCPGECKGLIASTDVPNN